MKPEDLLEALADLLDAGCSLIVSLRTLERVGGRTGTWAAAMAGPAQAGVTFAAAAGQARLLRPDELALLQCQTRPGGLAPLLRCLAARRRARVARSRALWQAVSAPLLFIVVTLLVLPLPDLMFGGPYWSQVFKGLGGVVAALAAFFAGLPWLLRHARIGPPLLAGLGHVPSLGRMVRLRAGADFAGALGALAEPRRADAAAITAATEGIRWPGLIAAASDARRRLEAGAATPDALRSGDAISESLAVAIATGAASERLPVRLSAWAADAEATLTWRLRTLARSVAFAGVIVLSVQGMQSVFSRMMPGLDGQIPGLPAGGMPNMDPNDLKELQEALDIDL